MPRRDISEGYARFNGSIERTAYKSIFSGKNMEHRWIYSEINNGKRLSTKYIVHHRDHNSLNNSPNNLEYMYISDHISLHNKERRLSKNTKIKTNISRKTGWNSVNDFGVTNYKDAKYYRVSKIEEGSIQEVWDLEVESQENQEDTRCFFANRILVHNCENPNLQNLARGILDLRGSVELDEDAMKLIKAKLNINKAGF